MRFQYGHTVSTWFDVFLHGIVSAATYGVMISGILAGVVPAL